MSALREKIYRLAPFAVRNCYVHADAFLHPVPKRYGSVFMRHYNFLSQTQQWSAEQIQIFQLEELQKIVNFAYENIPYYRDLWNKKRIKPEMLKKITDIEIFPFTTKQDVRENIDKFIPRGIDKKYLVYVTTGGTSGKPLGFYVDAETDAKRLAFEWRNYNWMGYRFGDKCMVFRGYRVDDTLLKQKIFHQYNPRERYLIFSSFHFNAETLPQYVETMLKAKIPFVRGYPSSLEIIAKHLLDHHIKIDFVKSINCSSENLFDHQREIIEKAFGAKIFDKFGNSEQTNMATQCGRSSGYHIIEEYGLTELVDHDEKIIHNETTGELGEIVGTGFTNYATPLIRYRTEDFATYKTNSCSCGHRGGMFGKIQGRWFQEQVVAKDCSLIAITSLNSHSNIFDHVKQFQYYQDSIGEITLRIVPKSSFNRADEVKILEELTEKVTGRMEISIKKLSSIPRTDRGKYRFLVQKLDLANFKGIVHE